MVTSKALQSFFDENFKDQLVPFLLYKDNQLLKEGKFVEFAETQLKKTRNILLSIGFALIYGMYYGVITLISYGRSGDPFELILGILAICFMSFAIFASTRQYYIIKGSMTLFLKLAEETNSDL